MGDIGARFAEQTLAARAERSAAQEQMHVLKKKAIAVLCKLLIENVASYNRFPGIGTDSLKFEQTEDGSLKLQDKLGISGVRLSFLDDELRLENESLVGRQVYEPEAYHLIAHDSEVKFKHAYSPGLDPISANDVVSHMFDRVLSSRVKPQGE